MTDRQAKELSIRELNKRARLYYTVYDLILQRYVERLPEELSDAILFGMMQSNSTLNIEYFEARKELVRRGRLREGRSTV